MLCDILRTLRTNCYKILQSKWNNLGPVYWLYKGCFIGYELDPNKIYSIFYKIKLNYSDKRISIIKNMDVLHKYLYVLFQTR